MQNTPILTKTVTAAAPIAGALFIGFNGELTPAGGDPYGVTDYAASKAGDRVAIVVLGTAKATAGTAFPSGTDLAVGPDGKAVVVANGARRVAKAVGASSGDGAIVEVLMRP